MTSLTHIRLLWWRKTLETIRTPAWVIMGLTTPLLYLALFAPVLHKLAGGPGFGRGSVLDTFLPGVLALLAFSTGSGAGWVVIAEMQTGVTERLLVAPVRRLDLLAGTVLRDIVNFLVPALIVIAVAIPLDYHPHAAGTPALLLLLSLVVATTSAWSTALGLTLRDIGALAAVVTGLQLPLVLLSGILLPLSLAPTWLRGIAHIDPLYYVVEAARRISDGAIDNSTVAAGYLIVIALTIATTTWATRAYSAAC
jgi:ABC-2 type transport system permease protein